MILKESYVYGPFVVFGLQPNPLPHRQVAAADMYPFLAILIFFLLPVYEVNSLTFLAQMGGGNGPN
jgi:hypothetical protein